MEGKRQTERGDLSIGSITGWSAGRHAAADGPRMQIDCRQRSQECVVSM